MFFQRFKIQIESLAYKKLIDERFNVSLGEIETQTHTYIRDELSPSPSFVPVFGFGHKVEILFIHILKKGKEKIAI